MADSIGIVDDPESTGPQQGAHHQETRDGRQTQAFEEGHPRRRDRDDDQ